MIKRIKNYVGKSEFASKWADYANLDDNGYYSLETPVEIIRERLQNKKEELLKKIERLKEKCIEIDKMEQRTTQFLEK